MSELAEVDVARGASAHSADASSFIPARWTGEMQRRVRQAFLRKVAAGLRAEMDRRNPYWAEVRPYLERDYDGALSVDSFGVLDRWRRLRGNYDGIIDSSGRLKVPIRDLCVSRYSWTIPDPTSLAFVAHQSQGRLLDPLAGTGYWAYLLRQYGVDVLASDADPPDRAENHWHHDKRVWTEVRSAHAPWIVKRNSRDRTLLISWPPAHSHLAAELASAHRGNRLIYMGEVNPWTSGCEGFYEMLDREWEPVAWHRPVRWHCIRDEIIVLERKRPAWEVKWRK